MAQDEDNAAIVATTTFFRALRREFIARSCKGECPVPELDDMRQIDRMSFLRCMKQALASAKPENVARVMSARNPS